MLNVAICDDENSYIYETEKMLQEFSSKYNVEISISKFDNGYTMLSSGQRFHMVLLDIEMESINGIELAEKIHKINADTSIVYITNYEQYWRRAYKVHAFGFIVKPINKKELFTVMADYINARIRLQGKNISLKSEDGYLFIKENDICYFYIEKKKHVRLKTKDKEYLVKENLRDIIAKLDPDKFYMSHKSCIINLDAVCKLENRYDIIMKDGSFMPLAQSKRMEFLNKLADNYITIIKGI